MKVWSIDTKRNYKLKVISLVLFFFVLSLQARVKLPNVLSDNMVLQQQTQVKLWGEALANKKVKIYTSWNQKNYVTKADATGNWEVKVVTPKAGGPYTIKISDGETLVLKNILIGEVWFCSGQSNMEMPVQGFVRQPVKGGNDAIAKAQPSIPIRIFSTDTKAGKPIKQFAKQPQKNCDGQWEENYGDGVANCSATAYFFAKYLQEVLQVPVGIIISSWGASNVEAWMSREALQPFSTIDTAILTNNETISKPNQTPTVLFNAKIAPLLSYTIKGFLWYQGESNCINAEAYQSLMPAFVSDLRNKWNIGAFPFYFVQIAPYNYGKPNGFWSAKMREVQEKIWKLIPNSGMVTTLDVGSPFFIHPPDKQMVGERLALWALGATYERKGFAYKPPVFEKMEIKEDKVYIDFQNAERGIYPMATELYGFEIAGADQVFYSAKAIIDISSPRLAVWSDKVTQPVAVRYAFKNFEQASIFGVSGIPVAPFRTDTWSLKE